MCAIFLDREGGAKRNAMAKDIESTLSKRWGEQCSRRNAPNRTLTGAELSNVSVRGAPKGPVEDFRADSVLKLINYSTLNYPSTHTNHAWKRLRALTDSSSDIDMSPDREFATSLCDLLEAEAWPQEQREKVQAWSLSWRLYSPRTSRSLPLRLSKRYQPLIRPCQSCHHRYITWSFYLYTESLTPHSDSRYSARSTSFCCLDGFQNGEIRWHMCSSCQSL